MQWGNTRAAHLSRVMRAQEIEVSKFLTPPIVAHDRSGRGWNALAGIQMPGISSGCSVLARMPHRWDTFADQLWAKNKEIIQRTLAESQECKNRLCISKNRNCRMLHLITRLCHRGKVNPKDTFAHIPKSGKGCRRGVGLKKNYDFMQIPSACEWRVVQGSDKDSFRVISQLDGVII